MKKHIDPKNSLSYFGLLLITMLLITSSSSVQAQEYLTWSSAIQKALDENPSLASAQANLDAYEGNINIARANYLPGISVMGSVSESKSATFSQTAGVLPKSSALVGASLTQMIYNEKYFANHKIQKYSFSSQQEQFRNTTYSTISSAGSAYVGLLLAHDLMQVQIRNMQITEENLSAAEDQLEVGSIDMQEVLRWKSQKFSNLQSVESQKASVISSRGGLNQLLNTSLETKYTLEKLSIEKDGFIFSSELVAKVVADDKKAELIRDYLVELGIENSPIIASLEQEILAQNRQLKSDKRWAIPSFSLSAGADAKFTGETSPDDLPGSDDLGFWKVGVSMMWPIVDGGANVAKVKQSRSQTSALELEKENTKTTLEQSIRSTVAVVISDFRNMDFASSQAEVAQKNYDLVYDSYQVGESDLLDLLDAQSQKLEADISYHVALYTFFGDLLVVEQAIGYFPFLETPESLNAIINNLEARLLLAQ